MPSSTLTETRVLQYQSLYRAQFGVELKAEYAHELVRLGVPPEQGWRLLHALTAVAEHVIEQHLRPSSHPPH